MKMSGVQPRKPLSGKGLLICLLALVSGKTGLATASAESLPEEETTTLSYQTTQYPDYIDYDDMDDWEESEYERDITLVIEPYQTRTSVHLEMNKGNHLTLSYQMLTSDQGSGKTVPMNVFIRDSNNQIVARQFQGQHDKDIEYEVALDGDYEFIFQTYSSNQLEKKIWLQVTVEGKSDPKSLAHELKIKTEQKYAAIHDSIKSSIRSIQSQNFKGIRHQIYRNRALTKGIYRAEALAGMITRWSIIHMLVVVIVTVAQVFVLKRFFNTPTTHKMGIQT